ncbi:MAG: ABC transporter permease [Acidimicrobiales bacterium]|jgi:putative ABC transport system permease protein
MFLTYLRRELRRRGKQAIVVAIGLAIGIGLVMTVSAASAGVKTAQGEVLHSLYGVGTDMTVTQTATFGTGGAQRFNFGAGSGTRPAAGTHISRNTLRAAPGEAAFSATDVSKVATLHGVAAATGGLALTDTSFSGTIPNFTPGSGSFPRTGGPGSSFNINSLTVDGIQISGTVGPLSASQITKGTYFSAGDNNALVAIVSSSYATQNKLSVGSTVDVAGKTLKVIGIASSSSSTDVFIPLGTAQTLAGLKNDVTIIYVSASSASGVSSVAAAVKTAIPKGTVTTSASLASEVTGSISSASNLATHLGKWLSIAALIVAFLIAGLLMMAAVSRRVQEFGTLKAIGWRTRRVVGQVMGEGVTLGLAGGVIGILFGIAGGAIVSAISPSLTATVGSSFATGGGGFGFGGGSTFTGGSTPFGSGSGFAGAGGRAAATSAARTVAVHLNAPLQGGTIAIAVALAIAGGLVAGAFGSWRAARLRPAAALRRVE